MQKIPFGRTWSYLKLKAVRAVANAKGANQLAIIISCHRVIQTDGKIGRYGGGISRKKGLIQLEKKYE